jgi:sugar/nucleoside kinase (ribokinase family)
MSQFDVLIIGRSCLDHIAVVKQLPEENRKVPLELRLSEGGGQGSTAACCVARLGGRPLYVGKLGDDSEGRFCRQRLEDFGVGTELVQTVPGGRTPVAYVLVTRGSGARTIVYEPSRLPPMELQPDLQRRIGEAAVILLDPETTYLAEALAAYKGPQTVVVYDCERWRRGIEAMMEAADYFVPSAEFLQDPVLGLAKRSFIEQLQGLRDRVRGQLVVTAGEYGAYYAIRQTWYQVGIPAVTVADTIGAGDNFHAAFAYALQQGFDLHRAVRLAVAVASLSCREYGGRNGVPEWREALATADRLRPRVVE